MLRGVSVPARISDPAASEGDAPSDTKRERGVVEADGGCSGPVGVGSSLTSLAPELGTRTFSGLNWAFRGAAGSP